MDSSEFGDILLVGFLKKNVNFSYIVLIQLIEELIVWSVNLVIKSLSSYYTSGNWLYVAVNTTGRIPVLGKGYTLADSSSR